MLDARRSTQSPIMTATLGDFFLLVLFNCLLFSVPLGDAFPLATYIDEACSILIFALGIFSSRGRVLNNWERCASVLVLLLVILGLIGNVAYAIQPVIIAIGADLIACTKFFMALFGGYLYFSTRNREIALRLIEAEAKIISGLFFVLALINLFIDSPMRATGRYAIPAFQGIWPHPAYLVFSFIPLLSVLSINWKKNKVYIAFVLVIIASSLRSKGLAIVGAYLCLLMILSRNGKIKLYQIAIIAVCAIYIGWDAFIIYYGDAVSGGGYARYELQTNSVLIANDLFPLGAGFGTFGSNASGQYYSPLYFQYGLSDVWGLQPTNYSFISDTFWPTIIVQFGWIGLILFCSILICVFLGARRRIASKSQSLAIMTPLAYLLISSTAEPAFFNTCAPLLAVCIAAYGSNYAAEPKELSKQGREQLARRRFYEGAAARIR